jgi:hypothetical protein
MDSYYSYTSSNSDSNSFSDSDTDLDTDLDADSDTDLDVDLDTLSNTEPDGKMVPNTSACEELDGVLDPEAKEILSNIARDTTEGPAKPKQTDRTIKLWKRESEFWAK